MENNINTTQISAFGELLLYIIAGIIFVVGGLVTAYLIRPHRPNEEKLTSYESGEEPVGQAWGKFNIRFYVIAIIFLLFDVEIVFLFPWATVFGRKELMEATDGLWGWFSLTEMFLFVAILALGLAYAWKKGHLDWVKPTVKVPEYSSKVPKILYEQLNEKYTGSKSEQKDIGPE